VSIATVVTRGFGSFGTAVLVVTRGYSIAIAPSPTPSVATAILQTAGGGFISPPLLSLQRTALMPGMRKMIEYDDEAIIETLVIATILGLLR